MKGIAYLVMVHKDPESLETIVKLIHHAANTYLIHVDARSETILHKTAATLAERYGNVRVLPSMPCVWGGFSLVDVTLQAIRSAVGPDMDWSHFINISGNDLPLVSQDELHGHLESMQGMTCLDIRNVEQEWPNIIGRFKYVHLEIRTRKGARFIKLPIPRKLPDYRIYAGSQWFILSREFCNHISSNMVLNEYIPFFKHTAIPDESFFQTILMNSPHSTNVIKDNKRYIIWPQDSKHPKELDPEETRTASMAGYFFARKVNLQLVEDYKFLPNISTALNSR